MNRLRTNALVVVLLAAGSVLVTWPLILHPASFVLDEGDRLFTSWVLGWVNKALVEQPSQLFDPPVFYPEKGALLFSETLLLPSILVSPVLALGGSPILAHSVLYLLSFILAGSFFFLMCRELGLDCGPSFLGGLMFTFSSYRMDFSHVQLSQIQYFPLQVLFMERFFRRRRLRYLIAAWLSVGASVISSSYYGVYALLLMILLSLFYVAANRSTTNLRTLITIAAAPIPTALVLIPYYPKYAAVRQAYAFERTLTDVLPFQADIAHYANYFYHNLLFSRSSRSRLVQKDCRTTDAGWN